MKKEFVFLVFALCFAVWAVVVDNFVVPGRADLKTRRMQFSRCRVKEWRGDGKWDLVKDRIIIYGHADQAEEFFYLEHQPHFEQLLKNLEPGTAVRIGYAQSFPKVWQRTVYEVEVDGMPIVRYSGEQLKARQVFVWKFTGIICGVFVLFSALGFLNKPRRGKRS